MRYLVFMLLLFLLTDCSKESIDNSKKTERSSTISKEIRKKIPSGGIVVIYFFHIKPRCVPCEQIMLAVNDVCNGKLKPFIDSGKVIVEKVNVELEENVVLYEKYGKISRGLLLSYQVDGVEYKYHNLRSILSLVVLPTAFKRAIVKKVNDFIHDVQDNCNYEK